MITLHALTQSRAYRIAWLLELLGLDYQVNLVARDPATSLAPAELRKLHPLGKSPLLQDGDLLLAESGAIVEYLLQRYGQNSGLKPEAGSADHPDYLFWLHYAEGSLMPLLVMSLLFRKIDERKMPFFAKPVARKITDGVRSSFLHPQLQLHLSFVEGKLAGRSWLLGERISGADVMMSFPLLAAAERSPQPWPNIRAYAERLKNEPAYRRAEEKLGKLQLL